MSAGYGMTTPKHPVASPETRCGLPRSVSRSTAPERRRGPAAPGQVGRMPDLEQQRAHLVCVGCHRQLEQGPTRCSSCHRQEP